ncbi:MAG TPA: pyridoxamine 5'-phosphate oxidase family protein [Blastocatellia bacterium]|nr:pyridoxamine 5'-phosphate oxidase family protein [Blastocatellia bacterium]
MKEISRALKEFCENQELLRLAYIGSGGYPRAVPVWFVVIDGDYCLGTDTKSAKWKAIKQDPRVGWVIDGGEKPKYKGISMHGRAEEVTGSERALIYDELGRKYFGTTDDAVFKEIYGEADNDETVYLRLRAEGGTSWDY